MNKRVFFCIVIMLLTAGLLVRCFELDSRSLEYDEIWTKGNFFNKSFVEIFTGLETPNNHPLHTLCSKTMCTVFGEKTWIYRMTALFFGVGIILAGIWGSKKFLRSKYVQICLIALLSLSPYLVHYSNTARGYSMQAFFVFAMTLAMFSYARKAEWKKAFLILFFALGAVFSVYSGLIFVCAASGAYMLSFFKWGKFKRELKKSVPLFVAGSVFALVSALWLGLNASDISAAQQFGFKINSVGHFFASVGHLIKDLNLIIPFVIIIAALIIRPKDHCLRFGVIFSGLVFLSVLGTKCGPERVYMPMIAVVLWCMAHGMEVICRKLREIKQMPLLLSLAVMIGMLWNMQSEIERISPPDWLYFSSMIEKNTENDCYIVYPAGDTMPIAVNHADAPLNQARRMQGILRNIAFVSPKENAISCLQEDISEITYKLPDGAEIYPLLYKYSAHVYKLSVMTEKNYRIGNPIIATFIFMPKKQYLAIREELYRDDECLFLNPFFNKDYTHGGANANEVLRAVGILLPAPSQPYGYYAKFVRASGGRLRFYVLGEAR